MWEQVLKHGRLIFSVGLALATSLIAVGAAKATLTEHTKQIQEIKGNQDKINELLTEMIERGGKDEQMLEDIKQTVDKVQEDVGALREDIFQVVQGRSLPR